MTTAEALRAGLERIRTVGWRPGHNKDGQGPCCAVESLPLKIGTRDARMEAVRIMNDIIGKKTVALWNDAPGRTQAEVEAVYERAIALAEAEEQK